MVTRRVESQSCSSAGVGLLLPNDDVLDTLERDRGTLSVDSAGEGVEDQSKVSVYECRGGDGVWYWGYDVGPCLVAAMMGNKVNYRRIETNGKRI